MVLRLLFDCRVGNENILLYIWFFDLCVRFCIITINSELNIRRLSMFTDIVGFAAAEGQNQYVLKKSWQSHGFLRT